MLIELSYIIFSLLLIAYTTWQYYKQKEKSLFYLALAFTFLTLSTILKTLSSTWYIYIIHLRIHYRFFEIGALALFACFTITTIIALTKTSKNKQQQQPKPLEASEAGSQHSRSQSS